MPQPISPSSAADAFRFHHWADAVAERTDLTPTQKLVAHALARYANAKTGLCCPGRDTLAAAIGTTRLKTISEATAALEQAGWLRIEHGRGNRASYVLLQKDATAPVQKSARAPQVGRQAGLPEERQAGLPTGTAKRNYEGKRGAPVGADSLSPSDDPATERAIVAVVTERVAAHTKLRPRSPTAKDRAAAADLAAQLRDADDWRERIDLALRTGLAGNDFVRGKVVTLPGLAEVMGELIGKADTAETGPPPARWDDVNGTGFVDASGDGLAVDEGARCANCGTPAGHGTLGVWPAALDGCCSRRCMLQVEHAATRARAEPGSPPAGPSDDYAVTPAMIAANDDDIEF